MGLTLVPPDPPLASDDFRLRPFGAHDVGAIVAAGHDPKIVRHTLMPEHPTTAAARDWLERAIRGGFYNYPYFLLFSHYDALRGHARFDVLMAQAKTRWEEFDG